MKTGSKIAIAAGAIGAAWLLIKNKVKKVANIGAIHYTIVGKVLDVWYKNTSYYGNNSYWVMLETDHGYVRAYTAANSQLGYTIDSMKGKTVGFSATRRKDGGLVLNSVSTGYDTYGNKK